MFGRISTRSRLARYALTAGLAALAFAMGAPSTAQAQSCSAGVSMLPFIIPPALTVGQSLEVDVIVENQSQTNPGGVPVDAILGGTTFVRLACADSFCDEPLPMTLQFDGCLFDAGEVSSCEQDFVVDPTGNTVKIEFTAAGVPLDGSGPGATASIARIQATAAVPVPTSPENPTGAFFARAQSNDGDLITDDVLCNPQVTGEAGGSVTATFPPGFPFVNVTKICPGCRPNEGNTALATITVTNTGDAPAQDCTVSDIFDNGVPVIVGTIPTLEPGAVEVFEYVTPSFTDATPNSATVECADPVCPPDEPECQVDDQFDTTCPCGSFVPPCTGVECEICFPDDLKGDKINPL